jgi:hypothetical protein
MDKAVMLEKLVTAIAECEHALQDARKDDFEGVQFGVCNALVELETVAEMLDRISDAQWTKA